MMAPQVSAPLGGIYYNRYLEGESFSKAGQLGSIKNEQPFKHISIQSVHFGWGNETFIEARLVRQTGV